MAGSLATSTAVDLSRLPPPDVVETIDYEAILADLRADLAARLPTFDAFIESDPAIKLLEICAYREVLLRQRVNDAARAVLVAYAAGGDLDNIAALFGVARLELVAADPEAGIAAVMESDEDLRRRLLLAPDAYSVAGPRFAYVFHALSAHGDVLDASATSPDPGEVVISVLSREGDGTAPPELLAAVEAVVNADDVRPLTDEVTVQSAGIVEFEVLAQLIVYSGPDQQVVLTNALAAVEETLAALRRIGRDVTRSALIAALHTGGVQNVILVSPEADVVVADTEAAWASSVVITVTGTGE